MTERRVLSEQCKRATLEALRALGGTATRRAIVERALHSGGFTPAQLLMCAGGSQERLVDRYLEWSLTWLRKDGVVENVSTGVWALAGDGRRPRPRRLALPRPAAPLAPPLLGAAAATHDAFASSEPSGWARLLAGLAD